MLIWSVPSNTCHLSWAWGFVPFLQLRLHCSHCSAGTGWTCDNCSTTGQGSSMKWPLWLWLRTVPISVNFSCSTCKGKDDSGCSHARETFQIRFRLFNLVQLTQISSDDCDRMIYCDGDGYNRAPGATQSRREIWKASSGRGVIFLSMTCCQQLSSKLIPYGVVGTHWQCPPFSQDFLRSGRWITCWRVLTERYCLIQVHAIEATILGLGCYRGTSRSSKFAQRLFNGVEYVRFEAIVGVEITPL